MVSSTPAPERAGRGGPHLVVVRGCLAHRLGQQQPQTLRLSARGAVIHIWWLSAVARLVSLACDKLHREAAILPADRTLYWHAMALHLLARLLLLPDDECSLLHSPPVYFISRMLLPHSGTSSLERATYSSRGGTHKPLAR